MSEHDVTIMAETALEAKRASEHANRRLIRHVIVIVFMFISVIFNIGLTVYAIGLQHGENSATRTLANVERAAAHEVYERCVVGNQFRAGDKKLWDFVLQQSMSSSETPQQQAVIAHFRRLLDVTEAQQKC